MNSKEIVILLIIASKELTVGVSYKVIEMFSSYCDIDYSERESLLSKLENEGYIKQEADRFFILRQGLNELNFHDLKSITDVLINERSRATINFLLEKYSKNDDLS